MLPCLYELIPESGKLTNDSLNPQALTLISEHLYGSSLKEESPDELLLGLASRY